MKSILTEITLSVGALLFWALALPAAFFAFPAIALSNKLAGLLVPTPPVPCTRPAHATA